VEFVIIELANPMSTSVEREGNGKEEIYPLRERMKKELLDPWSVSVF
jgi:hypothetical protein